jgi:hypothetical protein
MLVITSISFKTRDSFYKRLGVVAYLQFKAIIRACVNVRKKLDACEERLLALLLRRKLLKVNNPLKPVSKQCGEQGAENGAANTGKENIVCHKSVVWPNVES